MFFLITVFHIFYLLDLHPLVSSVYHHHSPCTSACHHFIPCISLAHVHLCCHHHFPCASTLMAFFSVSSLFFSVCSIPPLSICLPLIPCFPPQTLRWLVPVIPCTLSLLFRGVSLHVVSAHCQLWKCYLHCIGFELSSPWFDTAYLPSEAQRTANFGSLTFIWLTLNCPLCDLRLHTYPVKSSALPTVEAWPSFDWLWIVRFVIRDCILTQWSAAYCQLWKLDLHLIGFELSATWFESAYLPRCPAHYHLCKL